MVEEFPAPEEQRQLLDEEKRRQLEAEIRALDQMPPTKQTIIDSGGARHPVASDQEFQQYLRSVRAEVAEELQPYLADRQLSMDELVQYLQSRGEHSAIDGLSGRVYSEARSLQQHAKLAEDYRQQGQSAYAEHQAGAAHGFAASVLVDIQLALMAQNADFTADISPESLSDRLANLPNLPVRDPNKSTTQR